MSSGWATSRDADLIEGRSWPITSHARETDIDAPPERVWQLLTQPGSDPDIMFGAEVVSDWKVGSPIVWKGEWEGKTFEDKGEIIAIDPPVTPRR